MCWPLLHWYAVLHSRGIRVAATITPATAVLLRQVTTGERAPLRLLLFPNMTTTARFAKWWRSPTLRSPSRQKWPTANFKKLSIVAMHRATCRGLSVGRFLAAPLLSSGQ